MIRKFLCAPLLIIALICVFASCEEEHIHQFGEWTTTEATCTENGSKTRSCACGEVETEVIISEGHKYGNWYTDATCTEDGFMYICCSICEEIIKTEPYAKRGHQGAFWITDKAPSCTKDGLKREICSVCDATIKTEVIAKLGHTNGAWITDKEPSCTEDGQRHQACTVCQNTIKTEVITKLPHTDGAWIADKEPSCTEDGQRHQACTVCQNTIKTEVITKLPHTDGAWITDKEPGCTTNGEKHQICSVCKTTINTATINALEHSFGDWYVKEEATCAADGIKERACACSHKETMSYSVEHTNYFTEATESGGMFLANYYCPTCNINFDKEFEPITISCDVFYMYVSSSANIMWEIEASGGIGNYTYDIIMGEQSYSDESKYILTEIWSIENPFFAYTKEDTSHLMDIGYMFIITVYDSIGSVTYEIYFDNYWNSMPSHTIVKTPYTLN